LFFSSVLAAVSCAASCSSVGLSNPETFHSLM